MIWLSAVFFSIAVTVANGNIDDRCLDCICLRESGCTPIGCKMDAGSDSCGYYQIKLAYYTDCGQPGKRSGDTEDTAWKRCAEDFICASQCVENYMNRYAAGCQSNPTCEVYARVHNGGPNGCKINSTIGYWNLIQNCLTTLGPCSTNQYSCGKNGCCPTGSDYCGSTNMYCDAGSVCCPSGKACCPTDLPNCIDGETHCSSSAYSYGREDVIVDSFAAIKIH